MNAAPSAPETLGAWDRFWFAPRDARLLGMMRVLVGVVTLYTLLAHGLRLEDFFGKDGWYALDYRRELLVDRPTLAEPLSGVASPTPEPTNKFQAEYIERYRDRWGFRPPGPLPENEGQEQYADDFRAKFGYDFRELGLPFPANEFQRGYLEQYTLLFKSPATPPYPTDVAQADYVFHFRQRHGVDPRRAYNHGQPTWSVWYHVTDPFWMKVVHGGFVAAAALMLVGWQARLTSAATWFANLCYIHRCVPVLFGVDTMMNVLLLYLMIGPSGNAFSLDAWLARRRGEDLASRTSPTANFAVRAMQIHLCVIYFMAGVAKLLGVSWWNGTAVWGVLANFEFAPMQSPAYQGFLFRLSQNQLAFDAFIAGSGLLTLAFEIAYPFLIWRPSTRWLLLAGAVFLHGFIGLFMGLKSFSLTMLFFNLAFLRDEEVTWLTRVVLGVGKETRTPPA